MFIFFQSTFWKGRNFSNIHFYSLLSLWQEDMSLRSKHRGPLMPWAELFSANAMDILSSVSRRSDNSTENYFSLSTKSLNSSVFDEVLRLQFTR